MVLIATCLSIASVLEAFSRTWWLYCLCRMIIGMGKGCFYMIPMYIGETARKENRGRVE
ncbi:unnamed protein product [Acanthoscelides obtectus]|uniref:Major facilitator superfamily (MFS) profile domain-containing protein n=1 Tax=Acanthoscelides obtectus TaxID=200917 RepID=A0A9P0QBU2_ACAOB|nr:unnamed protein product [Acanthoscelides obtectus]CAK1688713.1 hypothetical protein AOBTE_LOCUS36825 [Acanthoscelides obtectus]